MTGSARTGGPRGSTVARQILVLQLLVVLVVVLGALALSYAEARRTTLASARDRAVAVAVAVADEPTVRAAVTGRDPSATLQPVAEAVRKGTGTDFVVVMGLDRTRFTHPDPTQIGQPFIGDLGGAPRGRVFTQEYAGTLGPSVRAVVPVRSDQGRVVALVSVGITLDRVDAAVARRLPVILGAAGAVLLVGMAGTALIARRLSRQTHGLGEREITRMYEYYDAVLHSVREGLVLVDENGRVQLVNDEARRLLGLPPDAPGRPITGRTLTGRPPTGLGLPASLAESMTDPGAAPDQIHLLDTAVVVVNTAPARWHGRSVGSVVTLRDHTELQAVAGELDTVRGLAESLRSHSHEAANRLHTVVSLVELGRTDEALAFATRELELAQGLTDRVVGAVDDPVVSALLLGKSAEASERGITLRLGDTTAVDGLPVSQRDAVTLLGNLIDNAFDAVGGCDRREVEVALTSDAHGMRLRVADSGRGLPDELLARVFERGWSTKPADGPVGRGLGLALVAQAVRRYDGSVHVGRSMLGGAEFDVRIGEAR